MKLWQYLQRTAKRTINIHISLYVISSGTTSFILNIFINKFRFLFLFLFLNDKFVAFLRGHRSYCVLVGPLLSTIDVCFFWQIEVFLFLFIFFFFERRPILFRIEKKMTGEQTRKEQEIGTLTLLFLRINGVLHTHKNILVIYIFRSCYIEFTSSFFYFQMSTIPLQFYFPICNNIDWSSYISFTISDLSPL